MNFQTDTDSRWDEIDQEKILAVISRYREPLKKIAGMNSQTSSDVADEEYPEHQQSINSVCSVE